MYTNSLDGCNCGMAGLSDMTDAEVLAITQNHFKNKTTSELAVIGLALGQGNFTPISNEVRAVAEKICTAGANDKIENFVKSPLFLGGAAVAVAGIIYLATK
jgi:hypothetical protein